MPQNRREERNNAPGGDDETRAARESCDRQGCSPEPRSESSGDQGFASLAPSHTQGQLPRRSGAQARSRGATAHKREARGAGDGARLRGASTGAQCDETGRSEGVSGGDLTGPVTPVRYDVASAKGRPAGVGVVPLSDGAPRVLRCALDWLTVLCRRPVSREVWQRLEAYATAKGAVSIASDAGPFPLEWRRIGRDLCARSVAGVRVLVREPASVPYARSSGASCALVSAIVSPDVCATRRVRERRSSRAASDQGASCVGWTPSENHDVRPELASCALVSSRAALPGADMTSLDLLALEGDDRRAVYGIEVQVQGAAFSSVALDGSQLARELWRAIARELLSDQFPGSSVDVAALVDDDTRAGRVDVAIDTTFEASDGASWVQWGIYAHGDHDGAVSRWSTRARRHRSENTTRPDENDVAEVSLSGRTALLGKATAGRTLYVGSGAYSLACIYERSKKRDGDWCVLEPTLRAAGWNGASEVVRSEFRVSRAWMRDQIVRGADGEARYVTQRRFDQGDGRVTTVTTPRTVADLTIAEFFDSLPLLAREFPSRFRHTDPHATQRVRDRASSSWWCSVVRAAHAWSPGASSDLGALVSVRRDAAIVRTMMRVRTSLARLVALRSSPRDDWGTALGEVLHEVMGAFCAQNWVAERDRLIARTRERYLLETSVREVTAPPEDDAAWLASVS